MPDQEEIVAQQELLRIYRRNLREYLKQQALQGEAFVQPGVVNGIQEAREQIARIKGILRNWSVQVEDHPNDEPSAYEAVKPFQPLLVTPVRRRVFLSYKHNVMPDDTLAQQIVTALRAQYDVFIDEDIAIGTRWAERIQEEIARADAFIILLSSVAVQSEMVEREVAIAHQLGRFQGGRPAIMPVRVAYHTPFSYPLSTYLNPLDWALWERDSDTPVLLDALADALDGGTLPLDTEAKKSAILQVPAASMPPPVPFAAPALMAALPLELPEGTMGSESHFYVVRATDPPALESIQRQGVTVTIKGPRQMGKSSLLARVMTAAQAAGKQVAFLDFQFFDQAALTNADTFFRQFCVWLSVTLDLDDRTDAFWTANLSNPQRCDLYMGRYVLKTIAAPLVLAMDEVESLFDTPFRSDFFGMLRGWHNKRAMVPLWKRLDLALVTSTEPYQLIANLNQSPFNVGQVLELDDFTPIQVADLNMRHGAPFDPPGLARLLDLLSGHPYLVRRALYLVASGRSTTNELFDHAIDDRGPFGDHLRYHLFRIHNQSELIQGLLDVIDSQVCDDERVFFRLRGAGLVRQQNKQVIPRNRLYADYFRLHLTRG